MEKHKFFGEILKAKGKLTDEMINNALKLQKDNPTRKLGEILVTLNYISYDDITDTITRQYEATGDTPRGLDKWLTQDEIDNIIKKMTKDNSNQ